MGNNTDIMGNFFSIKVESLIDNTQSLFDVYTLAVPETENPDSSELILYAKAPYKWTTKELKELISLGIDSFFIEKKQESLYTRYQSIFHTPTNIDKDLAPKFRIQQIRDLTSHLLESAFLNEIKTETVHELKEMAKLTVECIEEDPRCLSLLQDLGDHSIYTYIHSAGVGILAPAIAWHMDIKDPDTLVELALSGFFHDIGKKNVPLSVLEKRGPLSPDEWNIMKSHPEFGVEIAESLGFSNNILEAIGLHHEKRDGSGYPQGLDKDEIPEFVQIVTVADIFNALTTSRCYHFKRNRFEALMFMKNEMEGKISPPAFHGLVASLSTPKNKQ